MHNLQLMQGVNKDALFALTSLKECVSVPLSTVENLWHQNELENGKDQRIGFDMSD